MVEQTIRVEVVCAEPGRQVRRELVVARGCTAMQAIEASGVLRLFPALQLDAMRLGIYAQRVPPGQCLVDGDRVEVYRPLTLDPMAARRRRAGAP
ncbi:MAG: RnfH family protein [Rhodanobacter sp.]|nr:MAG: RnfH family protein [Rhodanobacter sp.]